MKTVDIKEEPWVTRRKIEVEQRIGGSPEITQMREIQHIHYHSWPDMGVPKDPEAIDALLDVSEELAGFLK